MVISSYKSFEDMLAAMESARTTADSRSTGDQNAVKPGDFVEIDHGYLMVYAAILAPDHGCVTAEEAESCRTLYAQPHMKGYRFTKAYSVMCPHGELGDIHVSTVTRVITAEEFNAALSELQ